MARFQLPCLITGGYLSCFVTFCQNSVFHVEKNNYRNKEIEHSTDIVILTSCLAVQNWPHLDTIKFRAPNVFELNKVEGSSRDPWFDPWCAPWPFYFARWKREKLEIVNVCWWRLAVESLKHYGFCRITVSISTLLWVNYNNLTATSLEWCE